MRFNLQTNLGIITNDLGKYRPQGFGRHHTQLLPPAYLSEEEFETGWSDDK